MIVKKKNDEIEQPGVIQIYNINMGGVDKHDPYAKLLPDFFKIQKMDTQGFVSCI